LLRLKKIRRNVDDRLPTETDKQYLGYTCYRDLGLGRTLLAAQRLYDQKSGNGAEGRRKKSATASYLSWAKTFRWEQRAKAWDLTQEERRRERLASTNREKYLHDLEIFRLAFVELAQGELAIAKASMGITHGQMEVLRTEAENGKPLTKERLRDLLDLTKCSRDRIAVVEGAKSVLYDAYAIAELTKSLNDLNVKRSGTR
jgi:hypothetical protein